GATGVPAIPPDPQRRPQPADVSSDACWPEGAGDRQAASAGTVRRNVRAPVMGVAGALMIRSTARILAIMTVLCAAIASAQGTLTPPQRVPVVSLTLEQALQYAVEHYPTVRAALEQVNASTAGVSVAK